MLSLTCQYHGRQDFIKQSMAEAHKPEDQRSQRVCSEGINLLQGNNMVVYVCLGFYIYIYTIYLCI